jgi:polysaccharide pyruvyl transferase CsaB
MRIAISSSYGDLNLGDRAILEATAHRLASQRDDIELFFLTRFPGRQVPEGQVATRIDSRPFFGTLQTINALRGSELLMIGGGGLLQDSTTIGNLIFHWSRARMARFLKVPYVLCGIGIGPLRSRISRWLVRDMLLHADWTCVRDRESLAIAQALKPDSKNITLGADLAFALGTGPAAGPFTTADKRLPIPGEPPVIGLSVRPPVGNARVRRSRPAWFTNAVDALATYCLEAQHQLGAHIYLISMHPDQDDPLLREIHSRLDPAQARLVSGESGLTGIIRAMCGVDIMVGMRLHSLILGAMLGAVPIGITYDPKVRALLGALGLNHLAVPLNSVHVDVLLRQTEFALTHQQEVRSVITERLIELRRMAEGSLDMLIQKRASGLSPETE